MKQVVRFFFLLCLFTIVAAMTAQKKESYRFSNSNKLKTKKEIDIYTEDMSMILFLPDNGRDLDLRR